MGFAPVARKSFPVMINNVKQFRSSSQGMNQNTFRLFADNDGKKITRDKEGEFFESDVSLHNEMMTTDVLQDTNNDFMPIISV